MNAFRLRLIAGRLCMIIVLCCLLGGCANIPLKEGGVAVGKDTTATVDDIGVARVTSQF